MALTSFIAPSTFAASFTVGFRKPTRPLHTRTRRSAVARGAVQNVRCSATDNKPDPEEEMIRMGQEREMLRMRERLMGLFGTESASLGRERGEAFDGEALREVIRSKWGRTFDVQPAKRSGRVYLQIMWRFFEQQSFYLDEDGFASHCEAVAQLLNEWDAVTSSATTSRPSRRGVRWRRVLWASRLCN